MREKELFKFIKEKIAKTGASPTIDEMKRALGINSKSSIYRNLGLLESEGLISRQTRRRGITLIKNFDDESGMARIPLLGIVAAGNPIEAILVPEYLNAPQDMLKPGSDHFALRVTGDSMIDKNILEGDKIVVRSTPTASNGDIVVALVDGREATVKTFRLADNMVHLVPANKQFQTIIVDAERVTIQGVVVGLLRYYQ